MSRPFAFASCLLVALAAACAVPAFAQMGGGMGGGGMGGGGMRGGGHGGGGRGSSIADTVTAQPARPDLAPQLQQLRADLQITPQQQPAWDALRVALLDLEWPRSQAVSSSALSTAMGALQQELTQAQNRYTLLETAADRLRALQALLTPAQQAQVDTRLVPLVQQAAAREAGGERGRRGAPEGARPGNAAP